MDWKSLTSKLDPLLSKAKEAGYKAIDFTQKQLQNTPLILKSLEDYKTLRGSKRLVLIAYDESDESSKEILLRSPIWSAQAWSDAAEYRLIERNGAPDIVRELSINTPLDMRVWYIGEQTVHLKSKEEIVTWWKTRCYDGKEDVLETPPVSVQPTQVADDPLAGK